MLGCRLHHDILFPFSPTGLFLAFSWVFTHGKVLLWGVICDIWVCWNRKTAHFTGLSFQVFKDVHILNVNLSISAGEEKTTEIIMLCRSALGAESQVLCDSNSFAHAVALPWANRCSHTSSLSHQNTQGGPQRKAIISVNLWSCLLSGDTSLVG